MRVFVAGSTGAIGRQLVPRLVGAGHEVHGMTRSASKQSVLSELGAVPVVADALDPDQVAEVVARSRPDVIVHQLTAIGAIDMRHFDRDFALTNRLRTEATDHLLSAGQAIGVRRFVAQGIGSYGAYARTGGPVKSEEDPLDPTPAREMRETLAGTHRARSRRCYCVLPPPPRTRASPRRSNRRPAAPAGAARPSGRCRRRTRASLASGLRVGDDRA
jgi:nucleoside-diphosphate-sugar epimerase